MAGKWNNGFTLIELMVTVSVLAIVVSLAVPSFRDFAERSWLRGVADNVVQVVGTARTESIKRNELVRVDFKQSGAAFCVGAATVASPGAAGCDCSAAACPLASFPADGADVRTLTMQGSPSFGTDSAFVVDPRTGMLVDIGDAGSVDFASPRGYGVRVAVNAMGRASLCTPAGKRALTGVGPCAP